MLIWDVGWVVYLRIYFFFLTHIHLAVNCTKFVDSLNKCGCLPAAFFGEDGSPKLFISLSLTSFMSTFNHFTLLWSLSHSLLSSLEQLCCDIGSVRDFPPSDFSNYPVCNKVLNISRKFIEYYTGNYSFYLMWIPFPPSSYKKIRNSNLRKSRRLYNRRVAKVMPPTVTITTPPPFSEIFMIAFLSGSIMRVRAGHTCSKRGAHVHNYF